MAFLFVDIEWAKRHWEQNPSWMARHTELHQRLIYERVEGLSGQIYRTEKDRTYILFPSVQQALDAANVLRNELKTKLLPSRMAIYWGAVHKAGNEYVGSGPSRTLALLESARGGQTLLSQSVQNALTPEEVKRFEIRELGSYFLDRQARPSRIYQLGHGHFRPLNRPKLGRFPNNLADSTTSFIGRQKEISHVGSLLKDHSLVTLVGAGGAGKTRLAVQCAEDALDRFEDGVWFVDLAVVMDESNVLAAIARTVCPSKSIESVEDLRRNLADRNTLVVLDNCEHLLGSCSDIVADLIQSCPKLQILTTSRQPLAVSEEQIYSVPSLSRPTPEAGIDAEGVLQFEAPRLFLERARLIHPEFKLGDPDAFSLASICDRLSGMPLAIELAAARTETMTLGQLSDRLDSLFSVLTDGPKTVLPRQQTLRAVIDWSYRLLSEEEQRLFRRLSVFAGSWTTEAAVEVCECDPKLLVSLWNKSVIDRQERDGLIRYSMLPTVRHSGAERLAATGELTRVQRLHCDWYIQLAQKETDSNLLDAEFDNFRAVLSWSLEHAAETDAALILVGTLAKFWHQRGFGAEARRWTHRALAVVKESRDSRTRLTALLAGIGLAGYEGDYPTAKVLCDELEERSRVLEDRFFLAQALHEKGKMASYHQLDPELAKAYMEQALALFQALPNCTNEANVVGTSLGLLASSRGDYEEAKRYFREAIPLSEPGEGRLACQFLLANTLQDGLEFDEAEELFGVVLEGFRELGFRTQEMNLLIYSGRLALDRGKASGAADFCGLAVEIAVEARDVQREQYARCGLSRALADLGRLGEARREFEGFWFGNEDLVHEQLKADRFWAACSLAWAESKFEAAARLLGKTIAQRETIQWAIPPAEKLRWEGMEAQLRERMSDGAFENALHLGGEMSYREAGLLLFTPNP